MSNSKNQPDAATNVQHVLVPDAAALGDPLQLAGALIRDFLDGVMTVEHDNECVFGIGGEDGPLDEAVAAMQCDDFFSARGWLQIAIVKALEPVPQITTGRVAKTRHLRAVFQRERALLSARCALHLILPALQGDSVGERVAAIFAPRH